MEGQKITVRIHCPIHDSEVIQRVAMDPYASQQLYCLECILSQEDSTSLSPSLKTLPDLLETAATFYAQNRNNVRMGEQVPPEYLDLLGSQGEKLEQLSKHIEDEKKKASNIFDIIMQDMVKMISEKKNEYLYELDQQLFNLRYWYIFFDKQIKKTYPSEEDIPFLYPTKEDLVTKLGKITNATQLMAFVRNLKEDLNEQKLGIGASLGLEGGRKTYLNNISKELIKLDNIKPKYAQGELELSGLKSEMKTSFEDLLGRLLNIENPIGDVVKGANFDSKLLRTEDFNLLKTWIPKGSKFQPKLVYRGSRDGLNGATFHKKCDGLKNTVSIIKAKFNGASKSSLLGGYLDVAWNSTGGYINSNNSFIFSLSTKKKATVSNATYGGQGNAAYGPTFGGGHDLGVIFNGQSYMNPHSYSGTAGLIEVKNYAGTGHAYFTPEDIEVYTI
jgi:hypothetical protein